MSSISNKSLYNRNQNKVQLKYHAKINFSKILIPYNNFSNNSLNNLFIDKNHLYIDILKKEIE